MITAQMKLTARVAQMTTEQLCEAFEMTNDMKDDALPTVREALMNELESRDADAFNRWMDSDIVEEMDTPSKFYI